MKIKYRSPMHFDTQNAQLGTKHGVHCRLTMGLMIGTTCLYSNFDVACWRISITFNGRSV